MYICGQIMLIAILHLFSQRAEILNSSQRALINYAIKNDWPKFGNSIVPFWVISMGMDKPLY